MSTVNGPTMSVAGHLAYWVDTAGTQLSDAAAWFNVITFGVMPNKPDSATAANNVTYIGKAIIAAAAVGGVVYFPAGIGSRAR